MKQLIIPVKSIPVSSFAGALNPLWDIYHKVGSANEPVSILLDFSVCRFVHPFLLSGLLAGIETWRAEGKVLSYDAINVQASLKGYLHTIRFPEGLNNLTISEDDCAEVFNSFKGKTFIPIVKFPASQFTNSVRIRETMLESLNDLLLNQLHHDKGLRDPINYLVSEITQNTVHHSKAVEGIVSAQFYPKVGVLDICLCDTGQGFLQSYINSVRHQYEVSDHTSAMRLAVTGNSTKDAPETRGYGISTSRRLITEGLGGKIVIWSGDAIFLQNSEKESIVSVGGSLSFTGCYVAIRIPAALPNGFDLYNFVT